MRERISDLMPDTTKIFIEREFTNPEGYDLYVEIKDGRIDGDERAHEPRDEDARQDLNRKLRIVAQTELFGGLDQKQQRLLAFSGQWFEAKAGQIIFKAEQDADAAYLCVKGLAGLYWPETESQRILVTEVNPGRLIGDLAVIQNRKRPLNLVAIEDSMFLRIGASELLAVIENDAAVATSLLRSVANHLMGAADSIRAMRAFAAEHGLDLSELDTRETE